MPKMHQNRFRGQALPGPTGLPIRNRGGPTSKGRDVSTDWSQDRTPHNLTEIQGPMEMQSSQ